MKYKAIEITVKYHAELPPECNDLSDEDIRKKVAQDYQGFDFFNYGKVDIQIKEREE